MAYSQSLVARVREIIGARRGFVEKKMFGGVGFLRYGNICVGVWQQSLIARVGPENYAALLKLPHAREFDITGRPMKGWIMIDPEGIEDADLLGQWIERSLEFVRSLPAKKK